MPVGVIIVAAGRGARLGGGTPKQLLDLGGRSILQRSVAVFDRQPTVAHLVVVLPSDLVDRGASFVGPTVRPCGFVAGGARRQDSVRVGFEALPSEIDLVLVHDAARPFADAALVDRVIDGARRTGASVPAVRARDTVKRVPAGASVVAATIPREEIWLAQTPQGFRRDVLRDAVALGMRETEATDEAMLAEQAGHAVEVVPGDERNTKITTPEDLEAARASLVGIPRVGTGYDLHALVPGRPLVLAGVIVPFDRGPLGHSDGDVISHAVVDALLGAAGAGDIGRHFPNTDARWKDVAGLEFVTRAVDILGSRGLRAANVDVSVLLERPKLSPHVEAISAALARALRLPPEFVSVKAKTNEGLDAVGRGEAIAAHAVAVIVGGGAS
jgi:2-C-methyl-D-erythritol 4-phosphate cytidylyltransferase/2-C-methyl-D-erythritol 2,4-cyclodiphosphate synthase